MPKRRPTKRRSTPTPKSKRGKTRPKSKAGRSPKRSAAAKKRARSAAAKKGWAKRRKKERLLKAMAEYRQRRLDQPLGWVERRASLRSVSGGKTWQQISYEFDASARDQERFAELARLEIDFVTRDELYDYLAWLAEEFDVDLSDMYRMYLGYDVGEAAE